MDLKTFFEEHPRAAVAFSGGTDSAYLLLAAKRFGAEVCAYYGKTAFQPRFELEDARRLTSELDVPLRVIELDILAQREVTANPPDRCYHCKHALFMAICTAAVRDGFSLILDGTNASDDALDRPGMRALRELSVRSPLRESGITKTEVRRLSREAGLFTWDKPAYACLATRIPTGEVITAEKLTRTEEAERFLFSYGLRDVRVRLRGGKAKLEIGAADVPHLKEHETEIFERLRALYGDAETEWGVRDAE